MEQNIIINIYYFLALIALILMISRYHHHSFFLFLLCFGFCGTLVYWVPSMSMQKMRVVYVVWVSYFVHKTQAWTVFHGKMQILLWAFMAFSVYFIWDALYMNDDTILMTFSQYSKYYISFATMSVMVKYMQSNPAYMVPINVFWGEFILVQIIISIIKYILFQFHFWEGMVGTFGRINGGDAGTSFPLVALTWVLVNSNMEIKGWKSWLFIVGLLLIGIATGKRAVILLFPAFFLIFSIFVARHRYKKGVMITLAMLPLFFYFGLRLTPSLNPEHKVWGRFHPEYALKYAADYSMGVENKQGDRGEGNGRVGAVILMSKRILDVDNYTKESWFGDGLKRIYAGDGTRYEDRKYNFGVNSRGSLTGGVMMYLSIGLIGVLLFITYCWFYFTPVRYRRLYFCLYVLIMYDFIFYNSATINEPLLSIILNFVMIYSQLQYTPNGKFVGVKHKFFT